MAKKPVLRWLGEFALVFFSVLGAFWVEEYRHNQQKRKDYINTLLVFRHDVHQNIRHFRMSYDTTLASWAGYNLARKNYVSELITLLNNGDQASLQRFVIGTGSDTLNFYDEMFLFDWRSPSLEVKQLREFDKFISVDSLSLFLLGYEAAYKLAADMMLIYKSKVEIVNNGINQLRFEEPRSQANFQYLKSNNSLRNDLKNLEFVIDQMLSSDLNHALTMNGTLKRVDEKLARHGVDTSELDRSNVIR